MTRLLGVVVVVLAVAGGVWYYARGTAAPPTSESAPAQPEEWLDNLYSRNPREVEAASEEVAALGAQALPVVLAVLRDHNAEAERIKAALKAAGIIGQSAAPAIPEVAALLLEQGVTSEAAIALSYMGPGAFPPLRDALSNDDPIVRRESLRSIGKLKDRAPLDLTVVLPLLTAAMSDRDPGVRAVGATYLGIIHEGPTEAIPVLEKGLFDADAEVRRSSAAALGSFGADAAPALPSLRKASTDRNEDVAREAGRTIVKLQGGKEKTPDAR
jgi:HEAT repeat protein